ncbi:hypothetical protein, partial [Corynebacterium glyciniphilum]|uniref:hypothetical protein n=1 Tax=Corynebacterium glyciniphilum TaxID=1404244 RepID=UPI0016425F9F
EGWREEEEGGVVGEGVELVGVVGGELERVVEDVEGVDVGEREVEVRGKVVVGDGDRLRGGDGGEECAGE